VPPEHIELKWDVVGQLGQDAGRVVKFVSFFPRPYVLPLQTIACEEPLVAGLVNEINKKLSNAFLFDVRMLE